jgi:cellulose synthase operon protein YhjQ
MTEHTLPDPNETPEDVASLYSWANLHGGKYRDFSASRAQMREKARQRMEQAIEEERQRAQKETEVHRSGDPTRAQDEQRRIEIAAQEAAQERARQAAELAAQQAAQQAEAARLAAQQAQAAQFAAQQLQAAQLAAQQARAAQQTAPQTAWQPAPQDRYPAPPSFRPPAPPAAAPSQEEVFAKQPAPWLPTESHENAGRPAWLMPERPETPTQPVMPPAPDDTLQGSRDRLVSRWFALRSVFEDNVPVQSAPAPTPARAPVLAVFSLAGGVGKTSLVATLGRVLSGRGERVLLVDTAAYGLLPFFFGARDQRPGLLRTFSPPIASGDAPIQMITLDPETLGSEATAAEALTVEIQKHARGLSRVIVDLATASGATTRRVMRMSPQILVPLIPDMCSVVSVSSIDAFFEHNNGAVAKPSLPYYVLNQFDPSQPLHLDIREVLREQLGDRLLPFVLRHTPAVSEALAEGMTIMDYAPNSAVTEDYASLAGWVKSLSAPASTTFRGVRWSER